MSEERTRRSDGVKAWSVFLRAHAALVAQIGRTVEEETGLPLSWYDVLLELEHAPEGLRVSELADRVVLSRSRVSRLVAEVARAGLVQRRSDPSDGRAQTLTITERGRERFRAAAPVYLRAIEQFWSSRLSDAALATIAEDLEPLTRET